jgi:hypothetical protein
VQPLLQLEEPELLLHRRETTDPQDYYRDDDDHGSVNEEEEEESNTTGKSQSHIWHNSRALFVLSGCLITTTRQNIRSLAGKFTQGNI